MIHSSYFFEKLLIAICVPGAVLAISKSVSENESCLVMSDSLRPYGLYSPWNSPGKSTGMDSLSILQGDLPNPGIEPGSPTLQVDSLPPEPPEKP